MCWAGNPAVREHKTQVFPQTREMSLRECLERTGINWPGGFWDAVGCRGCLQREHEVAQVKEGVRVAFRCWKAPG